MKIWQQKNQQVRARKHQVLIEVIDPTVYQMEDDYCYENYHTKFLPQLSKNVKDTMEVLGLDIDKNKFIKTTTSKGVTIIKKRK